MNSLHWGPDDEALDIEPGFRSVASWPGSLQAIRDGAHAHSLLGHDTWQTQHMRHLLAEDDRLHVWRMPNHQVRHDVAGKLSMHAWVARSTSPAAHQETFYRIPVARPAAPEPASVVSPSALRANPGEQASPAPQAAEAQDEPFDQDAQALTLRQAAANGTPFCEVCQRQR